MVRTGYPPRPGLLPGLQAPGEAVLSSEPDRPPQPLKDGVLHRHRVPGQQAAGRGGWLGVHCRALNTPDTVP